MVDETIPEVEWEHSHALEAGDELVDTYRGKDMTVTAVSDSGTVTVKVWTGERYGSGYTKDTYREDNVRSALTNGLWKHVNGKSHELATF